MMIDDAPGSFSPIEQIQPPPTSHQGFSGFQIHHSSAAKTATDHEGPRMKK